MNKIAELTTRTEIVTTTREVEYVTLTLTKEQATLLTELTASCGAKPLEDLYYALNNVSRGVPGLGSFMDYPAAKYGYTLTRTPVFKYDATKRTVTSEE